MRCPDPRITIFVLALFCCATASAALEESSNRECATCHIMWLNEFKQTEHKPLVPYDPRPVTESGKEDVVSTSRMCLSCHDGFVLDSRDVWKPGGHNHPVGQKPSDGITIPTSQGKEIFPLNDDGNVYCGTCHSAHSMEWSELEDAIFMRMSNEDSKICMACHFERSTGPTKGNHPVGRDISEKRDEVEALHAKVGGDGKLVCESCHRPHGAEATPLLATPNDDSGLCVTCHDEKRNLLDSKHNIALTAPRSRNIKGTHPGESGPCSACHTAHDARGPKLWSRSIEGLSDFFAGTCESCHQDRGLAEEKPISEHSHPVNVPVSNLEISVSSGAWRSTDGELNLSALPLFDANGARSTEGGNVTCFTCHDVHQWRPDGRAPSQRGEEGNAGSSFLRIAADGKSPLCVNCHTEKRTLADSKHDLTMAASDLPNAHDQLPDESGMCGACHVPHADTEEGLWAMDSDPEKQGLESRCAACHGRGEVADEHTTGLYSHPVHVSVNGDAGEIGLPLGPNQTIDCNTCHDVHLWQQGTIAEGPPPEEGNGYNSFLRVQAAGDSPLCTRCHQEPGLVMGTDHDLRVSNPEAVNHLGQTPDESGICGQCHVVHNAKVPFKLWAEETFSAEAIGDRVCTTCHEIGGRASAKVPNELRHPERQVPVNSSRQRSDDVDWDVHPVYDEQGESVALGQITCITCHTAHQWDPARAEMGPGQQHEGTVQNSFLRAARTEHFLCADCHGSESLYRYKYFHWPKSRNQERSVRPE